MTTPTTPRFRLPYGDLDSALTRLDTLVFGGWSPRLAGIVAATRTFAYHGGFNADGSLTADGTIVIADNATRYVQRSASGAVTADAVLDISAKMPMATVTTLAGAITHFEDIREVGLWVPRQKVIDLYGGTAGDLVYSDGTDPVILPVGANGQVLALVSGSPQWVSPASGGGLTVDPYWNMVVMLLHLDATPGVEKKGHTVTRTGTTQATGTGLGGTFVHPYGASWPFASFAGGTDKIVIDVSGDIARLRGTQNFTIEFWFNTGTGTANMVLWTHANGNNNAGTVTCGINSATNNGFVYFNCVGGGGQITGTHSFKDSHWHHFMATRSGDTWRLFVDGVLEAFQQNSPGTIGDFTSNFTLGNAPAGSSGVGVAYVGYLSDVRYTIGQARAGIAFNAPTSAYPDG